MVPTTVKLGKRGNLVLPAKLRRQFGLEDGSLLIVEASADEIRLRPAILHSQATASQEDRDYAIYMLLNSRTQEEWDANLVATLELGVKQTQIDGLAPNHRETLPTRSAWEQAAENRRASRLEALHSS
jgi:AbrB family looped-hinge helix DNA binding protein